ncbi:hypothetical protein [Couchioplanes azureus]|uniref:hypothetical protein n=2 Tax=Couchioplanes caeruleus TaxID=56438 RepID=UPI001670084B|nr:hypothetical protein [Couchioplanes caeruleus]
MDETGHSGDAGTADGGSGAESRDRTLLNGWAARESPWSNAGAALDPEAEIPAWRRPGADVRPFSPRPLPADPPPGDIRPFAAPPPPPSFHPTRPASAPPSAPQPASVPPPAGDQPRAGDPSRTENGAPRWSDSRARYQDLVSQPSPNGADPRQNQPPRAANPHPRPDPLSPELLRSTGQETDPRRTARQEAESLRAGRQEAESLRAARQETEPRRANGQDSSLRRSSAPEGELRRLNGQGAGLVSPHGQGAELRGGPTAPPASAPPYPYEGDLDDTRPTFGRRAERESARHALSTPAEGPSRAEQEAGEAGRSGDQGVTRSSYDPSSFPRRLPYQSPQPVYPARPAGDPGGAGAASYSALPQRVPAQPDVPTVPEPPSVEPSAETPALARIATHLRRGDVLSSQERQEGFDVNAILEAVREVGGVRDAALRTTPAGAHSLRLDLSEGADPAEVSRQVARLLQERMGLDAAMQGASPLGAPSVPPQPTPPVAPRSAPPASLGGPPASLGGPPASLGGPPASLGGPPASLGGPPASLGGPPGPLSGPSGALDGSSASLTGPSETRGGPSAPLSGPPASHAGEQAPTDRPSTAPRSAPPVVRPLPPVTGPASAPPAAESPAPAVPFVPAQPNPAGRPAPATPAEPMAERAPAAVPTGVDGTPARPLLEPGERPGPRVMIEKVEVGTFGTEATVRVCLVADGQTATGEATGPAIDGYLLRLCAMATAHAVDELLARSDHADGPARCFVEHAAAVPFGSAQVAVVVVLLATDGWVEQLAGSAVVAGDDRHAMVRATLAAVNRRLEALLSR